MSMVSFLPARQPKLVANESVAPCSPRIAPLPIPRSFGNGAQVSLRTAKSGATIASAKPLTHDPTGVAALLGAGVGCGMTCDELAQACVSRCYHGPCTYTSGRAAVVTSTAVVVCYRMERTA
jgi:hypothetical protein